MANKSDKCYVDSSKKLECFYEFIYYIVIKLTIPLMMTMVVLIYMINILMISILMKFYVEVVKRDKGYKEFKCP